MLQNFLKIALRNLRRHAGFTFINIAGLTLGLTACLMIGLFVWYEQQFDRFLPGGDQVYRLYTERSRDGEMEKVTWTPPMYATGIRQEFPEVDKTVRIMNLQSKTLFEKGEHKIYEEGGLASEESFLEIFPLPLKFGSAEKALANPNSIILTEQTSEKYFGKENPVGKELMIEKQAFVV